MAFYTGGNGFPKSRFRLHIYEAQDDCASPGKDLLNENIVLNPHPCEGWDEWDLSSFNIPVSEKGYFIALEFVAPDMPFVDMYGFDYRPCVQFMRPAKEQNIWSKSKINEWREEPATGSISRQYNAMVKVVVDLVK
ncbi:hypothetical protein [Hymenobacter sp. IS2118]|uniref:hypothetical protein n=1 Tax=Hymenobacter sp. IS2118 TaxID=1505605 RepID=UPI00126873BE|nr:hypothetical protein [Hymenobacter sp. IS2118]